MRRKKIKTMLNEALRTKLIEAAIQARDWAYAPYSHYRVGAALLTASGKIYEGVNIENAAFSATVCAERVALFKAVSEGERDFVAIAVATRDGGAPCGVCRQVMSEFGQQTIVLMVDDSARLVGEAPLAELLPGAFLPGNLE
jgi:cytidine deaminase